MSSKSINKIAFYNILSTVFLQGLSLFTSPIFSRMLGPTNYGIVSVYFTWVSFVSITFGLQTQSTIAIAKNTFSHDEQIKYQSSILSLSILSYFVLSCVVILLIVPLSKVMKVEKAIILLILVHGFGQVCINFANLKFTYEFKANLNFLLSLVTGFVSVAISMFLVVLLPKTDNYWGRIIGTSSVYACIGIFIAICIIRSGRLIFSSDYWKFCLALSIPIIFHNLSGIVLNQSDRIMLQYLDSLSNVGIYSLSYAFGSVITTIWNALNNSWVPFYYELSNNNKTNEIIARTKNYCELFTIICAVFMLLSPEVFRVFASAEYWEGANLLPIIVVGLYFIFMYSFPVNYEFFCKKTKTIALGTSIAAIANIGLNIVFIRKIGIYGAAIATLISYLLQFVFHLVSVKRIERDQVVKYQYTFRMFLFPMVLLLFVAIVCYFVGIQLTIVRWMIGISLMCFEILKILKRKAIF